MLKKFQLLSIILAISITVGDARAPKKILDGLDASIKEVPHQVSLQRSSGFHFCGGSIIAAVLILTAAHCIVDDSGNRRDDEIYVVFGTSDKTYRTPYNEYRVIRRIRHNYNHADSNKNDIAILVLEKPIEFTDLLIPGKLPTEDVSVGTRALLSGWGATTYDRQTKKGGNYSQYLQKVEKIIISQQVCQDKVKNVGRIGSEHLCAWSEGGTDGCTGDSGGPLTYEGAVIGIASFGVGCGLNYPDVYTRVYYYVEWIKQVGYYLKNNLALPNSSDFVEV